MIIQTIRRANSSAAADSWSTQCRSSTSTSSGVDSATAASSDRVAATTR
jgi:hypothetical protein